LNNIYLQQLLHFVNVDIALLLLRFLGMLLSLPQSNSAIVVLIF